MFWNTKYIAIIIWTATRIHNYTVCSSCMVELQMTRSFFLCVTYWCVILWHEKTLPDFAFLVSCVIRHFFECFSLYVFHATRNIIVSIPSFIAKISPYVVDALIRCQSFDQSSFIYKRFIEFCDIYTIYHCVGWCEFIHVLALFL